MGISLKRRNVKDTIHFNMIIEYDHPNLDPFLPTSLK